MNRALVLIATALLAPCLAGCPVDNSKYCDANKPCPSPMKCDVETKECVSVDAGVQGDIGAGGDMTGGGPKDMVLLPDLILSCKISSECKNPTPICTAGECGKCAMSADCEAGHPSQPYCISGDCLECRDMADCAAKNKACDAQAHKCVPCTNNADCTSELCDVGTGLCVSDLKIIYVDKSAPGCANNKPGTGTRLDPFCKIADGLSASKQTGTGQIVVRTGKYQEDLVIDANIQPITVTVTGEGNPTLQPANANNSVLSLLGDKGGMNKLDATFDGFTFTGASSVMKGAIACAGGNMMAGTQLKSIFTLRNSTVTANAQHGIDASYCTLNVDRCTLGPKNGVSAINLLGDGTIQNSVIAGNGAAMGKLSALNLYAIVGITVVNDTIVGNQSDNMTPAGTKCGAKVTLFNTVLFSNSGKVDLLIDNGCVVDYSAFPGAQFVGGTGNVDIMNCNVDGLFTTPLNANFQPKPGSTKPCTLIAQGAGGILGVATAPNHDFAGAPRPGAKSMMFDIGAYQTQ